MGKKGRKTQLKEETFSHEMTIQLDSTDDTDIIESSIVEYDSEYDFIKRGTISSSKKKIRDQDICHQRNSCGSPKEISNAVKFSFNKNFGLVDTAIPPEEPQLLLTPCSNKNLKETNSIMKKLISTLKKTPDGPYLSKSKLHNIQQWLIENDTETIRTPPFANLSVTPIHSIKKPFSSRQKDTRKNADSSIDSEVESVLKAVYGDDWKQENAKNRPRTEPKKIARFYSPAVEAKSGKTGVVQNVRRNILHAKKINFVCSSDEENKLDDSILSGVGMINLNISYGSDEQRNVCIVDLIGEVQQNKAGRGQRPLCPSTIENAKQNASAVGQTIVRRQTGMKSYDRPVSDMPIKTPKKTFLASLSVSTPTSRCHPEAQHYKVNFKSKKDELVKKLYKLYNSEVFEGKLAEDLNFSWNVKLRGTAGYCYNKRITKSTGEVIRMSRIEFSTKIVDRADRVRDTMIHELCHAASWVIDGVLDGHGDVWSKWASRAMARFPELPKIKRCHNYDIVSKYVYRCTSCGYSIKRHSKSIDTDRKRCGHCYGVLELLINRKRKGKGEVPEFETTRTLPTPNRFAIFVKENYHSVKSSKTNAKHSDVMKALSQQYALMKNGTNSAKK